MVTPHLSRIISYANKQIRYDLRSALEVGVPDVDLLQVAEDQVDSTLKDLISKGVITKNTNTSCKIIDDVLNIDVNIAPMAAVNSVNITLNVDISKKETQEENEERRFQVYIENKTW